MSHIIKGLGREGAELSELHWDLLRDHGLVRTAEEACEDFDNAPVIEIADLGYPFATSVHRVLRACLHACSETARTDVVFVQAGKLPLQIRCSDHRELVQIHAGWLSVRRATEELGLSHDLAEDDVVFHTVKRLFSDTLELFTAGPDSSTGADNRLKAKASNMDQNLLAYLRLKDLAIEAVAGRPELHLQWKVDPNQSPSTVVEIHCHQASSCSYLRGSLLTADDGKSLSR